MQNLTVPQFVAMAGAAATLLTVILSIGASWGVSKMLSRRNYKDIEILNKQAVRKQECTIKHTGEKELILSKIEAVDKRLSDNQITLADQNKKLDGIFIFIGRVEEHLKNKQ